MRLVNSRICLRSDINITIRAIAEKSRLGYLLCYIHLHYPETRKEIHGEFGAVSGKHP